ncbi:conserved hypothetical protein [Pyrobaculum islandicum DSM 4184]|uniref:Uncharacterized protein n=1 Tax=Pyrobaculum islandicum (strain DSM 4184 / JCM 9189 / GEO3) TaxID=384616 RepID=A1RUV8_PYRIL|nr:hypothetical protein [Pyrobaculum islandicum]ABL88740.1 conserved hypothetical protein [Pyrobaculum islandicum DSM 4184]
MLPLDKLRKLGNGYNVVIRGRQVEVVFTTPTLGDAASDPELGDERRTIVIRGVIEGDMVKIIDAYVEDQYGYRGKIDLRDLELWIEYINKL